MKTSDQKCADKSPLCLGTVLSCSLKKFFLKILYVNSVSLKCTILIVCK